MNKFLLILCAMLLLLPVSQTLATSIGPDDFEGNELIEDFSGLGLEFFNSGSLYLNGITFTTNNNLFRYYSNSNPEWSFGSAITTDKVDDGWIDVIFDTPLLRAGGWTGMSDGTAEFFDSNDNLLGTVSLGPHTDSPLFAGWEAENSLIGRIRFNDNESNGLVLMLDRVTSEAAPVPEPSTMLLLVSGLIGLAGFRGKFKKR